MTLTSTLREPKSCTSFGCCQCSLINAEASVRCQKLCVVREQIVTETVMHPFNLRILAEDLVRVRRPDDRERYAASQRQARIDPNPHQIDAVIFALRRLREGGCILADEVGLGKTIEAGLVIAQSRAEGAERILLIVPKSLIGQWQNELANLFAIQAQDDQRNFVAAGVYLVGREFAGSERGAEPLAACAPFDLVVIDEAHEIFAGLHKRFGRDGIYDDTSDEAL